MSAANRREPRLGVSALEVRDMPSVSSLWFSGNMLVVKADNAATSVTVGQSGSSVVVSENGTGRSWSYAASSVGSVQFQGGAGNDRFVNNIAALRVSGYGAGGHDYLEGYNGNDYFEGNDGNDTVKAYGGNDVVFGGAGDDVLLGMAGNDQLVGDGGNDRLNGGAGADSAWGGDGDDVIIMIDNATGDYAEGNAGRDIVWVDRTGGATDRVYGTEAADKVQFVDSFRNGADRTLDGDRIADPTLKAGASYRTFANNPLFAAGGPRLTDVKQGSLGDCWVLAGLGAVANDNAHALRQNVVDFDDGTYGVRLGNNFYRVDNDLPVYTNTSSLAYAQLGAENAMWVAVAEKAYAHYRTGANSYASIEGGWSVDVNRAFGTTAAGDKAISSYSSATAMANDIFAQWNGYGAVTVGFVDSRHGKYLPGGLINSHMYTVYSVTRNASGAVTGITLRNPWGRDTDAAGGALDGNNDGFVTVTPAQLYALAGRVNYGRV